MNNLATVVSQTPIEIALGIDENGMTTARKLYEFLEMNKAAFARWARTNIECNEFYEKNKDWWGFNTMLNGNECRDYKLATDFAKHLSMESHSPKGKEARNYFLAVEDKLKEVAIQISDLPPEMQMFKKIFDQQARQYIEMQNLKEESERVSKSVEGIREIVAIDSKTWREDTTSMIKKIAMQRGGGQKFGDTRAESYELLEKRMGVDLKIRLVNKRRRMADDGVSKSKRESISYLDVIAEDKKLIEGYVAIVKEMAIKYGVGKD